MQGGCPADAEPASPPGGLSALPAPRRRRQPPPRRPTPLCPPLRRRPLACWGALAALRRRTFGPAVVGSARLPPPGAPPTRLQSAPRSRPG